MFRDAGLLLSTVERCERSEVVAAASLEFCADISFICKTRKDDHLTGGFTLRRRIISLSFAAYNITRLNQLQNNEEIVYSTLSRAYNSASSFFSVSFPIAQSAPQHTFVNGEKTHQTSLSLCRCLQTSLEIIALSGLGLLFCLNSLKFVLYEYWLACDRVR